MPSHSFVLNLERLGKLDQQKIRAAGAGSLRTAAITHPARPRAPWTLSPRRSVRTRIPAPTTTVRRPGRKADRHVQFVIETKAPIQTDREIIDPVRKAMNGSQLGSNAVANNLKVEPLFPGADLNDSITRLARYYLLVVPVSFHQALLMAKKRVGVFWDLAYQIRDAGGSNFVLVDPDLPAEFYVRPLQSKIPGCTVGEAAAPPSVDWARRLVRLDTVPGPVPTGQGVVIGHVDTGHTAHPELDRAQRFNLGADRDIIGNDNNAQDPMLSGSSHGTATASVMTSRHGTTWTAADGSTRSGLNGAAPGCTVVSARAIDEVVIVFNTDVARAIWHCVQQRVHVITMSLGGYANPWLQAVIAHAVYRENIIVSAAAGNCWPWVVFPAAYPEVIACGGVGIDPATGSPRIWTGSAEGRAVDICAPAENVYVADFDVMGREVVRPGEGTSFASPHVAAIAALWLERHGRANLLQHYAGSDANLCEVFRHIIKTTAQTGAGWDTTKNGAGIIDATAVLAAPLPAANLFSKSLGQWKHMSEQEVAYLIFDYHQRTKEFIEALIASGGLALNSFLSDFGREFNQLVGGAEDAWEAFVDGMEALGGNAATAAEDAAEAAEDFVEDVADAVSDTLSTVAGWFGL